MKTNMIPKGAKLTLMSEREIKNTERGTADAESRADEKICNKIWQVNKPVCMGCTELVIDPIAAGLKTARSSCELKRPAVSKSYNTAMG